ncbi:sigma-70 family RNA polymerase sigma factor [Colwellia psychrerythraea]|uniref:RNA polymerase, sigma-24 subunit, RpoE, ECF subfamily n=1 Tax=Colwellia psychrerythraea TaxID=28229 RepID=A0A099KNL9_COLPS|nr:sigma-70 family RNA polymerase sigma factor [Colwellia psychrerythraea]KGJ91223.1 RNA polymerase, sigma-24 subunit, RpoE, ECF subfamily [Colwellia psychrerythraea]
MLILDELSQDETDESLMLSYANGNASAFDLLYQRHKLVVFRFFVRQNLAHTVAEELAHDTWLKIINARQSYVVTAKFTTYLFTVARRLVIDYQQKKSHLFEVTTTDDEAYSQDSMPSNADDEQTEPDKQALSIALKQQISLLPFEQREVFLLKQEAGFSIDDIANITQQNKEKVKSRWRYALKKMRKGLSFYVN